jgi:hypothetical protein
MLTQPASPSLMVQTLGTLDLMDQDRQAVDKTLRAALIQSVTLACEAAGDETSEETIANAVDRQLAAPTPARAEASFGWDRPTSEAARQAQLTMAHSPSRKSWRKRWRYTSGALNEGAVIFTAMGMTVWNVAALGALVGAAQWPGGRVVAGVLALDAIFLGWLWPKVKRSGVDQRAANRLPWWAPKNEADMLTDEAQWLSFPATRHYLQQCFLSPLPRLMQQDAFRLNDLLAEAKARAELKRRQQLHDRSMSRLSQAAFQPPKAVTEA